MNKKELILNILEGLYENSKLLRSGELGIAEELWNEVVAIALQGELIFGAPASRDEYGKVKVDCYKQYIISIKGIEYLEHNKQQ
ncbi:YjcQ family protein [Clostridium uliginosum]|uniref:YjcQ protein n=1 Tax=Clostridium uliginosum TaxID=119641 RepID=A0A1I1GRK6_9CLOT|nr:YjcQ family protein [Clostridium uliginosum]SFC14284.1 YjcQ protein [Clostridium uliginosum]